jgi:hypothetical protein
MARFTKTSKGRIYRGFIIRLQSDERYDVFEQEEDVEDGRPISENFQTIALAMGWIDQTQFD